MNNGDFERHSYYFSLKLRMNAYPAPKYGERVGMEGTWRGISADEARIGQRIMRVAEALERSESMATQELQDRLGNLNLSMVLPLLTSICHDIALYMGGSVIWAGRWCQVLFCTFCKYIKFAYGLKIAGRIISVLRS
jgi:hypothetical protein